MQDIETWLSELGLTKYLSDFVEAEVDSETLPHLTEEDLVELNLPLGPRRKIASAIASLGGGTPTRETTHFPTAHNAAPNGAERRQLTVMFVDMVGSTALSTQLDPEDMGDLMRAYQNAVSGEVLRYGGHVAKFLGDGVLAYFGWPKAYEDAPDRAVRAGRAAIDAVSALEGAGGKLAARVGVATGLVVVGDLVEGDPSYDGLLPQEEMVVGKTPNLAARLQTAARPGQVVISEETHDLLDASFDFEDLGAQDFNGLDGETAAFAVLGESVSESRYAARSSRGPIPLFGREKELGTLRHEWATACQGCSRIVVVGGEAGIGKSHIVQNFADEIETDHHWITWQCSPYHEDTPLWPALQNIARRAQLSDTQDADHNLTLLQNYLRQEFDLSAQDTAHLAPLLGIDVPARLSLRGKTPAQQRVGALESLISMLSAQAHRKPTVLVLEDAHWIDPSTYELLMLARGRLTTSAILFLVTSRLPLTPDLWEKPEMSQIPLARLDRRNVGEIIRKLTYGKKIPQSVFEEIVSRTDGVPLFVEEMTNTVLGSDSLQESSGGDVYLSATSTVPIPSSLQDALMVRLDRMGVHKEMAQMAAVIGRNFDAATLQALSGVQAKEMNRALKRLREAGLITVQGSPRAPSFAFKHALVRDAAYETLLKRTRQKLHLRLLEVLEGANWDRAEVLARHAQSGGDYQKAVFWRRTAGAQAVAQGNFSEADMHLDAAEKMLEYVSGENSSQNAAAAVAVTRAIASLVQFGYGHADTSALFEHAVDLANASDDPDHVVAAYYGVWAFHYVHGDVRHALRSGYDLAKAGERLENPTVSSLAESLSGISLTIAGKLNLARQTMSEALPTLSEGAADRLRAQVGFDLVQSAQCYLAWIELVSGKTEDSRRRAARVQATNIDGEEINGRAFKLSHQGALCAEAHDFEQLDQIGQDMLTLCQKHGLKFWEPFAHAFIGWHALETGDPEFACASLSIAHEEMRAQGGGLLGALVPSVLAEARAKCGDDRALDLVVAAIQTAHETGRCFGLAETMRRHGRVLEELGQSAPKEISRTYKSAMGTAQSQGAILWELRAASDLAQHYITRGKTEKAQQVLTPLIQSWDGDQSLFDLRRARKILTSEFV